MQGIVSAIADAIRSHQESTISAISGIWGTVVGSMVTLVLDWIRNRGKVSIMPVEMHWCCQDRGGQGTCTVANANQVRFDFELRVTNTFPTPKSISLQAVEFYREKPRVWRNVKPSLITGMRFFGEHWEETTDRDIQLPPHSFTRVWSWGVAMPDEKCPDTAKALEEWHVVRLEFLVSPLMRISFWHEFTADELGSV